MRIICKIYLDSDSFQIDDKMFRNYLNFLFDSLEEKGLKRGDNLQINIDCTTIEDKFLILHASIIFDNINHPLYFSMRKSPNKAKFNHKLLEKSFIGSLKHLLSKQYHYCIVADRGFGNRRFFNLCAENSFDFCIRLNENLKIKIDDNIGNLQDFSGQDAEFEAFVIKWKKYLHFSTSTKDNKTWFIASNASLNAKKTYEKRFKIESMLKI